MALSWQPVVGQGTRARKSSASDPGSNLLGNSMQTRFLWSVMLSRAYSAAKGFAPLVKAFDALGQELAAAFDGVQIENGGRVETVRLIVVGYKGNWPALTKAGSLQRHHLRQVYSDKPGAGICHMCNADMDGFKNWQDVSWVNMVRLKASTTLPWKKDPAFIARLNLPQAYKASFYKVDLFHTCHKGLMPDIAANTMAPRHNWFTLRVRASSAHRRFVPLTWTSFLGGVPEQCSRLYALLKSYCVANKLQLPLGALTRAMLGVGKSSEYPVGTLRL